MRKLATLLLAISVCCMAILSISFADDSKRIPKDIKNTKILPSCDTMCCGYWSLLGNTNGDSSFLGTTDNTPFILRTNNQERIRVMGYDSVKIGLINLSSVFGNLQNHEAVIHFLKDKATESDSNAYIANQAPGAIAINGRGTPPANRARLEVSGMIRSWGNTGGFVFPDGSVQKTAQTKGDKGETGPAGPQGPAGVLSFYYVNATLSLPRSPGGYVAADAQCKPGDFVVGGGYACPEGSEPNIYIYVKQRLRSRLSVAHIITTFLPST